MFKRSKKLLAITFTLALCLYVAPLAFAQMGDHHGGGTTGGHYDGDGHNHGASRFRTSERGVMSKLLTL